MNAFLLKALSCPFVILSALALLSFGALAAAFGSEAFLGLEPCILCVYQRWPYAVVLALSLLALALRRRLPALPRIVVGLDGLAFLVNTGIASYHTGVERHWWLSMFESCAAPDFSGGAQSILENIMSAPTGDCSKIPWQDPVIGLSMANYNAILCFALFMLCAWSFCRCSHSSNCHSRSVS